MNDRSNLCSYNSKIKKKFLIFLIIFQNNMKIKKYKYICDLKYVIKVMKPMNIFNEI